MTKTTWQSGKNVLISGATVGIGYELAKFFAADKFNLVLVARNKDLLLERMNEFISRYQVKVKIIPTDLSKPGASENLFQQLQEEKIAIHTLVNNAGFGLLGSFVENDLETELSMIRLNITALTTLTKLFLKEMIQDGGGRILNVASTAAFQPGPNMAVYYATKAYVLSLGEALAEELGETPVVISTLCPGPTATEFQKRAHMGNSKLFKAKVMEADEVAKIGYRGLQEGKTIVIPGLLNKLAVQSLRFSPRKWVVKIVRILHS